MCSKSTKRQYLRWIYTMWDIVLFCINWILHYWKLLYKSFVRECERSGVTKSGAINFITTRLYIFQSTLVKYLSGLLGSLCVVWISRCFFFIQLFYLVFCFYYAHVQDHLPILQSTCWVENFFGGVYGR